MDKYKQKNGLGGKGIQCNVYDITLKQYMKNGFFGPRKQKKTTNPLLRNWTSVISEFLIVFLNIITLNNKQRISSFYSRNRAKTKTLQLGNQDNHFDFQI